MIEKFSSTILAQSLSFNTVTSIKKLLTDLIKYLGLYLSGSNKRFLIALTNSFLKDKKQFLSTENINLIIAIIELLSSYSRLQEEDIEIEEYLDYFFSSIIRQNKPKLTSLVEKKIYSLNRRIKQFKKFKKKLRN